LSIAANTLGHSAMIHAMSCYKVDNIIARSQTAPLALLTTAAAATTTKMDE